MSHRFTGKKTVITGASSGIGRAAALEFAREGAALGLIARNEERLNKVADECRALGAEVFVFLADTSVQSQIKSAVDWAVSALGGIDVLFSNAGIYLRREAKDLTLEQIHRLMDVNYFGTLHTIYAALPYFLEKKGGSIITTCSMDGKKGVPPDAAYVATKFALNGFLQVMRQELRPLGIHVGTIFPSRTDTPQIAHVDCPKITPKADASLIARAVLKCADKKKKEMMVPYAPCKLLVIAEAISPSLGDWMVKAFKLDGVQVSEPVVKEEGLS